MKILVTLCLCMTLVQLTSFGKDFEKLSLEEALVKGKQQSKPVFLYFTIKACGPCFFMEKDVFPNDTISQTLRNDFIAIKFDGDSWRGEPLAKKYQIMSYPTLLILDADGNIIKRNPGALEVGELKDFLTIGQATVGRAGDNMLTEYEKERLAFENSAEGNIIEAHLGVRLGLNGAALSGTDNMSRIGWSAGLFLAVEKGRVLLRPGLEFDSRGNQLHKLPYLTVPIDVGVSVWKGGLFGLPAGLRCIVTPYYSVLLNDRQNQFKRSDYGFRNGIAVFVGETSKIELLLSYQHGLPNISKIQESSQRTRTFNLTTLLTF